MTQSTTPTAKFTGGVAAVVSPLGPIDQRELALVAVQRTRMPMVITDPRQAANPIILANQAFIDATGYSADEIVGRNCRFLQGPDTSPAVIAEIRAAVADERECTHTLLNYRKDGSTFWNELHLSPIRDDDGRLLYIFASQKDVTHERAARELEAAEHRLLREVDHRAKNAMALVQGIVRLSRADDVAAYALAVQGRVDALARAHALLSEQRWRPVLLDRLVRGESEPFGRQRITLHGPAIEIPASQVQPIALLLHELLSNAAAHGALSSPQGTVAITWTHAPERGAIAVVWQEAGGPRPAAHPPRGFGLRIVEEVVRRQLNGQMLCDWQTGGLAATITIVDRHSNGAC